LWHMVQEGKFRADLYYRLNVFPINLPPLRERIEDIPALVEHFVRKFSQRHNKSIDHIPEEVMEILTHYFWPGNIRELQNFIERSVIMMTGPVLHPPIAELRLLMECPASASARTLADAERAHITGVLEETHWVVGGRGGAAVKLGLPRTTLISKMHKLGIARGHSQGDFALPDSRTVQRDFAAHAASF
jgi:formate hydrogenlyase transcriptional activator